MAKSDVLEVCDSPGVSVGGNMGREADDEAVNDHTIHSGHFMVSRVHGAHLEEDEDPQDEDINDSNPGYDFESAPKEPATTYQFGDHVIDIDSPGQAGQAQGGLGFTNSNSRANLIDSSLTKLFECMTLAYSGKLTSPKWKNFKGVKLPLKDKIRLNNIIWREWHMQFIQGQSPIVCQFEPPISDKTHTKAEAIVLEGKYWKRRLESVTAEYKKWRIYYKNHFNRFPSDLSQMMEEVASHAELLDRLASADGGRLASSFSALLQENMEDDFSMDFSDTLFTTLNQPFAFPNPKELAQLGNADIIQPGLIQLQPSFDDFMMDTLEPLPSLSEMFGSSRGNQFHSIMQPDTSMTDSYGSLQDSGDLNSQLMLSNSMGNYVPAMNTSQQVMAAPQPMNTSTTIPTGSSRRPQVVDDDVQILSPPPPQTQQLIVSSPLPTSRDILQTASIASPQIINLVLSTDIQQPQLAQQPPILSKPTTFTLLSPLQSLLQGAEASPVMTNQQQQPQPQQTTTQPLFPTVQYEDLLKRKVSQANLRQTHQSDSSLLNKRKDSEPRRGSTGSVSTYKTIVPKTKEGPFVIPQTPVGPRPKGPRNLAPATLSSSNSKTALQKKNTFLAQLLTQGNSPGGNVMVKSETNLGMSPPSCQIVNSANNQVVNVTTNYTPIRPAPITTTSVSTLLGKALLSNPQLLGFTAQSTSVSDFQKSLLIASASETVRSSTQKPVEVMQTASPLNEWNESLTGGNSAPGSPSTAAPLSPAMSIPSPASDGGSTANKPFRPKNDNERKLYNEHRRASHITAEQKRRCNIRVGFETLHQIVPALSQNPNTKISKAATLQKTADYLAKLKVERSQMQDEQEVLRKEIDSLNAAISVCQSQLPATGVPVTRQRFDQMREMFDEYVRNRTLQNWKFWIFSIIIRPLFDTYNNTVSTASTEELCRTVLAWLDQNCSLVALRPGVLNSLRTLSISTSILSDPTKVPEQATEAVSRGRLPPQAGQSSQ